MLRVFKTQKWSTEKTNIVNQALQAPDKQGLEV